MNWARGFFRAWTVFTVLWVGGFAISVMTDKYISDTVVYFSNGKIMKASYYSEEARELTKLESSGLFLSGKFSENPEYTYYVKNDGVSAEYAARNAGVDKFIDDDAQLIRDERFARNLNEFLTLGLGIPALVLIAGTAVGWIFRGFSRKPSPNL